MSSSTAPSLLASIPADISLLASLPDRPNLLSLLPSAASPSAEDSLSSPLIPQRAPANPPQTADVALPVARSFMAATAGSVGEREKEVDGLGEKVDRLRAQLEEVRDGLTDGAARMGWLVVGAEAAKEDDLA